MKSINHLIHEKSPYLLQHAHNPVQWYPWGEAAFAKARTEGKPIFLSVGYSTCHWCHVMAHESFEDDTIAELLNDHFVSIKVDREERPDIDRVYMAYVQATSGSGGWPMSVWLTPDLKPFLGGTYYPPEDRWGRPGFKSLLLKIATAWNKDQARIMESADQVTAQLQQFTTAAPEPGAKLEAALLQAGYHQLKDSYEPRFGGFGSAPKFPRPVALTFMLRYHAHTGTRDALEMCLFTLRKMADGGLHDHLGGGFHRYSVDDQWHVPHFEKMLYDQAQLVWAYLDAYQITHDPFYAGIARSILDYVLRDMTGKGGEFFSAEDADSALAGAPSRHAEGAFYVWTQSDIAAALGTESAPLFCYHYGIEPAGNVANDPQNEFHNQNILIVRHTEAETSQHFELAPDKFHALLATARQTLLELRANRPRPHRDDKTLTAWNGLMISAFARAAQVLDEPRYLTAALKAARFIDTHLFDPATGLLQRRYRAGETAVAGFADDYAFFIQALLDLYEASFDEHWLTRAMDLQKKQDALFLDTAGGGYFSTTDNDPSILLRMKEAYDSAEPSANSVSALNLLRLSQMTGQPTFRTQADLLLSFFCSRLQHDPSAMPLMLSAFAFQLHKPRQIIIAGQAGAADTQALLRVIHSRFIPNKILLLTGGKASQSVLTESLPVLKCLSRIDRHATAYLCENYTCQLPTQDATELAKLLMKI